MADKGSTWFSGAGSIAGTRPGIGTPSVPPSSPQPHPTQPHATQPAAEPKGWGVRTILAAAAVAAGSALLLTFTPTDWTWELLRILGVLLVLLGSFYFPQSAPKPAFVIWWIMLIGECIFFREGDANSNANAYAGNFPTAAYGEAIAWIMCLLATLLCSARVRGFFRQLFQGDYKWNTLFALACIASCAYTPRFSLGAVWGVKICLVVLLLWACSSRMRNLEDTISFLRFNVWAYVIIVLQPVIIAAMRGDMFDEEGRMSTIVSPNALSPNAAILLLMVLAIFSRRKGEGMYKWAVLWGMVGVAVMILAGSKTGVLGCVFAGTLFFIVRGRLGTAFTYIATTAALVIALVLTTPLADYLHLYEDRAGAESFSGRTILWKAVIPEIEHRPIVGHGYMASEFVMFQVNAVGWAAPHLHNGFLESLYNTGAIGFIFLVMMLWVIPKNLIKVLRRVPKDEYLYRVAAGSLALYAFLVINGFFNSSFGGKCTAPFMSMMALVVVSQKLLAFAPNPAPAWKRIG
ncbi:MAG TPA: O-antigen ligase family protein [Terriglobales bacterium]|nr:O-antigen ligase family protein [Terriglobales bacterium]